ncbi:MAG: class A beta-lactamase-related serine hydrolase [Clostridia bacterium]|nr:class A beta-lactamase-related serine hydrolase [Clostridia bacterium]
MKFDSSLPIKERIQKRRRQKRRRQLAVMLSLFLVCTFIYVYAAKSSESIEAMTEDFRSIKFQPSEENVPGNAVKIMDISPEGLIADSSEKAESSNKIASLKSDLNKYISGFKGIYGIYYLNLTNGDEFGINESQEYIAASTVKVPMNLYLYAKIHEGSVKRDGVLTYMKEDYEEGTGELRYAEFGKQYPIYELSRLSIVKSDNVATNMLFRFLGKSKVKDFMVRSGGMVVKKDENLSCPRDMALYMKLVYDFYKKDPVLGKELMGSLEKTEFNERLPALLPKNLRIAHKTGNQVGAIHDVGIVFADTPYILSVMSRDVNEEEAFQVVANISKKVYDHVKQ